MLSIILLILAAILLFLGLIGTIVPVIPGVPLAWGGILLGYFSVYSNLGLTTVIICLVVTVIVTILDNVFPAAMTKKSGGSKAGVWGSTIGLILGMFLGPWGIIAGPFCGALIGEFIHDHSDGARCFKAALGAFKGFLFGTGIKMITVCVFIWIFVYQLNWSE